MTPTCPKVALDSLNAACYIKNMIKQCLITSITIATLSCLITSIQVAIVDNFHEKSPRVTEIPQHSTQRIAEFNNCLKEGTALIEKSNYAIAITEADEACGVILDEKDVTAKEMIEFLKAQI